eukprot:TRINITY_DN14897_c0_g1_i7.p1 TRINITY_DN14897_c0_g1~~TRINITY_DN14897_c0_g1_i7.p1  ORF type:complete len:550 (-),score=45.60 TRINITY_DN14897_c0_g1_i7:349-1971(-)
METIDQFNGFESNLFVPSKKIIKSVELNGSKIDELYNGGVGRQNRYEKDNFQINGNNLSQKKDLSYEQQDNNRPKYKHVKKSYGHENIKAVMALAVPALGAVLADPLMSLVDTACVGQISSLQLAALGPNTAVFNLIFQVFQFLGVATSNIIATNSPWAPYINSNEKRVRLQKASRLVSHALYVAIILGILLALGLEISGRFLFVMVGANEEIIPSALQFLRIRALATPGVLLSSAAWGVCIGQQDAITPLFIYLFAGAINLVLDLYLVLVVGTGIRGAAIATTTSQYICCTMFILHLKRQSSRGTGVGLMWSGFPRWQELKPFMGVASTLLLRTVFTMLAYTVVSTAATLLGTIETAAHQVALQIFWFLAFVPEPLSLSAQSLIARDINDPVRVKSLAKTLLKAGAMCGAVLSLLIAIIFSFGLSLFTSDQFVRTTIQPLMYPCMTATFICSIVMMVDGVSIGCCDFKYLPRTNLIAAFSTSLMLIIGDRQQQSLTYVWWSMAVFFQVRLILHMWHHTIHRRKSPFGLYIRDKVSTVYT